MIYTDEIANTQGESVTLADMNIGSSAATGNGYAPKVPGRLIKVILIWAGEAVTSLMEFVRVELNCTAWVPNIQRFGLAGANIRTAPAFPLTMAEYPIDEPVASETPIAAQYIYADAATPITCNLRVFGVFATLSSPRDSFMPTH